MAGGLPVGPTTCGCQQQPQERAPAAPGPRRLSPTDSGLQGSFPVIPSSKLSLNYYPH